MVKNSIESKMNRVATVIHAEGDEEVSDVLFTNNANNVSKPLSKSNIFGI